MSCNHRAEASVQNLLFLMAKAGFPQHDLLSPAKAPVQKNFTKTKQRKQSRNPKDYGLRL